MRGPSKYVQPIKAKERTVNEKAIAEAGSRKGNVGKTKKRGNGAEGRRAHSNGERRLGSNEKPIIRTKKRRTLSADLMRGTGSSAEKAPPKGDYEN